jgi:dsDNA-binding SOS-regulon protein
MKNMEEKEEKIALWILAQKNVHQRKLKNAKKISDTPKKIKTPQKVHKLNLSLISYI